MYVYRFMLRLPPILVWLSECGFIVCLGLQRSVCNTVEELGLSKVHSM